MKNIQSIRNIGVQPNKKSAIEALKTVKEALDGTPVVIRYEGEDKEHAGDSAILGFAYRTTTATTPIYAYVDLDNDAAINALIAKDADLDNKDISLENAINALKATVENHWNHVTNVFVQGGNAIDVTKTSNNYVVNAKVDNKTMKIVNDKLESLNYTGVNPISISNADANNNRNISLVLDAANKFLTVTNNGLYAELRLNLTTEVTGNIHKHFIQLTNNKGEVLSQIDANDFIVDGLLDNVEIIKEGADNREYLVFTFNTGAGKNQLKVDLGQYINSYTAGKGINITNRKISTVMKANTYLDVTDADGITFKTTKDTDGKDITVLDKSINARIADAVAERTKVTDALKKELDDLRKEFEAYKTEMNRKLNSLLTPGSGLEAVNSPNGTGDKTLAIKLNPNIQGHLKVDANGLDWKSATIEFDGGTY